MNSALYTHSTAHTHAASAPLLQALTAPRVLYKCMLAGGWCTILYGITCMLWGVILLLASLLWPCVAVCQAMLKQEGTHRRSCWG